MTVEITERGYLVMPVELAEKYFPQDSMVAIPEKGRLMLLPIQGHQSGGLLMKRRNMRGDRSILLVEVVSADTVGFYPTSWDDDAKALIVDLESKVENGTG